MALPLVFRASSSSRWRVGASIIVLALAFWARVLLFGRVLLPGDMLAGFAPFGNNARASWTILQWDALAQYFPWRHFAASQLQKGHIPLWNPYQFTGTPFLANAQSAIFYPLNIPFWFFDTAYAFGISAFLGSVVALIGTFLLSRRWGMSRAAAIISATAFAFCGFLSSWALLPTLFQTACWLPLCLYFYEGAVEDERSTRSTLGLAFSLVMALLAGHAQVFFYILLALALRQPFLKRTWRGLTLGLGTLAFAIALGALQLLPTLELAKNSPRVAAGGPTAGGWDFVKARALAPADLLSLTFPTELSGGTLSENFGYVGVGVCLLALLSLAALRAPAQRRQRLYALSLALFGLLYALATPLAQLFFFAVPGVSSMGGTGRSLVLWSMGAALCAGFGFDWLRSQWKSNLLPPLALAVVVLELFANAFTTQPTSPREAIYPKTQLTDFLTQNTNPKARVWLQTDKRSWIPLEYFRGQRTHPLGILPPNGATVYGIYDINGYDSLSLVGYRLYASSSEAGGNPSPDFNGNMVLLQTPTPTMLDQFSVRWIVTLQGDTAPQNAQSVLTANGCTIYERPLPINGTRVGGEAFAPGFREGQYAPETFRLGTFISLLAISFWTALFFGSKKNPY
ncbi:hypothetical protein IAD21_06186 [Abditibacteriota bacterium]|nr:hypothetical protein IAD21_06186 [Abditibacteriota bacterium]